MKLIDRFINITKPANQVLALVITLTIALIITYAPFKQFETLDPYPHLEPITPQMIWEEGGYAPVEVDVGLNISNFRKFDILKNEFIIDGILWFEFNPAKISLDTIDKFVCKNGTILKKSEPNVRLIGDKLFVEYAVRIQFVSKLEYKLFPFDDHRVYIAISNNYLLPTSVMFTGRVSTFTLSENIYIPGWYWVSKDVRYGYERKKLDEKDEKRVITNPKIIFSLDFKRSGVSEILLIFLPLFLVTFLGLFAFAFDSKEHSNRIIAIASAMITALLGYKFVIQTISPKIGTFMLSDHIFLLFLTIAFITFVTSVLFVIIPKISKPILVMRSFIFIGFHIIFLVWWYYLLYVWG